MFNYKLNSKFFLAISVFALLFQAAEILSANTVCEVPPIPPKCISNVPPIN